MLLALFILLQSAAAPSSPSTSSFDLSRVPSGASTTLSSIDRCNPNGDDDDIVVCGNRRDRYRLPLPIERPDPGDRAGDMPSGMAVLTPATPCGIFAGERRCSKAEAAKYGYGGGRDPLTLATQIVKKVVDPDAD